MADNTIGWGQGSVNNTNDWGKGKANSTNDWGSIYANSPSGETNIEGGSAVNPDAFIIQVKTDNTGTSADNQFTLPWTGTYDVDWGDGNTDTGVTNTQTHTYSTAGTYDVSVTATTGRIYFNNGGDKAKLLEIKQWGTCQWTNMLDAFEGCSSLTVLSATDTPDLSSVFLVAKFIKGTNLVSGNFDDWDITPLTSLSQMFNGATSFNSPLNSWDTSNVTNMYYAFGFASSFNQPINSWDTSGVTNMSSMFIGANSFNQPLDTWDVSNVTNMGYMFYLATSFNQPLDNWNVSQVANFTDFMRGVTLSTANYDALLIAWDAQGAMSYSGTVNFGGSTYTLGGDAEAARTSLIAKWGGIIDGGGVLDATTNLVASYNFDADFTDYTGNNNLTANGDAIAGVTGGKVSDCAEFDGNGDYAVTSDSSDFSFATASEDIPFTIGFWVKFNSVGNRQTIIMRRTTSATGGWQIDWDSSNKFRLLLGGYVTINNRLTATFPLTPVIGTWYNIVYTYDASATIGGIKGYLNGVSQTITDESAGTYTRMPYTDENIAIGTESYDLGDKILDGLLDELHVWKNRELSASEVLEIYSTENGGTSILP